MPIKSSPHENKVFIIPTFSNREGLLRVLKDINDVYPQCRTVVINNDPKAPLEESFENFLSLKVSFINNKQNDGFAKAVNDGAKKAKEFDPDYLVFLNDDIRFNTDWVGECIKKIQRNKWVASVPILFDLHHAVENYGFLVLPFGKVELIKNKNSERALDGLTAAALVFKSESFFKLGGFDERFFAYLEDVDLFLRAKKQGMKFGITKNARVTHEGQKTSSQRAVKKAYLDFRNWMLLIGKNWGFKKILLNLPAIFVERLRNLWGIIKAF